MAKTTTFFLVVHNGNNIKLRMMTSVSYSFLPLVLAITFVGIAKAVNLRSSMIGVNTKESTMPDRDLVMKATIECNDIRDEPYRGRLTLQYEYRVDTFNAILLDVAAIEDALVQAVVAYLDACDDRDRPMYAVEMANSHTVSATGEFFAMII